MVASYCKEQYDIEPHPNHLWDMPGAARQMCPWHSGSFRI